MSTKKNSKKEFTATVNNAVKTAKDSVVKANDFALKTTENVVTETIEVAGKWQKVTNTAVKGGLKLMDNQQKLVFDSLEMFKSHILEGKKRFGKIFA